MGEYTTVGRRRLTDAHARSPTCPWLSRLPAPVAHARRATNGERQASKKH